MKDSFCKIDTRPYSEEERVFYLFDPFLFFVWVGISVIIIIFFPPSLPEFILMFYVKHTAVFLLIATIITVGLLGFVPLSMHLFLTKRYREIPRLSYLQALSNVYGLRINIDSILKSPPSRYYGPSRYILGLSDYPLLWYQEFTRESTMEYPHYTLAEGKYLNRKVSVQIFEMKGFIPKVDVQIQHTNKKIKSEVKLYSPIETLVQLESKLKKKPQKEMNHFKQLLEACGSEPANRPLILVNNNNIRLIISYPNIYTLELLILMGYDLAEIIEKGGIL